MPQETRVKNEKLSLIVSIIVITTFISTESDIYLKNLENLAKHGNLAAQIELINFYRKGLSVIQDYKIAVKWFTLAAEQGNTFAQYNLGRNYLGSGVPENLIYAHMWAKQSSSNAFKMGTELTELPTELMTKNQIKEARRLGNERVTNRYKGC